MNFSIIASYFGQIDTVKLLISYGDLQIDIKDDEGRAPLHEGFK